jgi:2-phosphoglycerate kinase
MKKLKIIIGGFTNTGKSTLADFIAAKLEEIGVYNVTVTDDVGYSHLRPIFSLIPVASKILQNVEVEIEVRAMRRTEVLAGTYLED